MSKTRLLPLFMYATAIGMEMCCLYFGLVLLRQSLGLSYVALILILLLHPLSFLLKLTATKRENISRHRLTLAAALSIAIVLVVIALAIHEMLTAGYTASGVGFQIGFCGLAWWLGNTLVRRKTNYYYSCFRFQIGILVLLVLALAQGSILLPVILFFILAVFALASARWQSSLSNSQGTLVSGHPWQVILGSAAVLVPAACIFLTLSPDVAKSIIYWLSMAINSLLALAPVPAPTKPIEFNFSCSIKPEEGMLPPSVTPSPPDALTETSPIVLWLILFTALVCVLCIILLTIRKIKAHRQPVSVKMAGVETSQITLDLFSELPRLLKKIRRKLWYYLLFVRKLLSLSRFRQVHTDESVSSVRGLYRNLLHWAALQALPRAQSQTPLEYLKVLCQKFPHKDTDFRLITNVYVQVRYSRSPAISKEFETVKKAWENIKSAHRNPS